MNIQLLPPKMLLQFAKCIREGKYDNYVGSDIYEIFQGNQVVCLIGLDNPVGHIQKISAAEMEQRRKTAKKK